MAEATRLTKQEKVVTLVDVDTVVLVLTVDEAQALTEVCARVGTGWSEKYPGRSKGQQNIENVLNALQNLGFKFNYEAANGRINFYWKWDK